LALMLFYFVIVFPFLRMMVVMVVVRFLEGAVMINFVNGFFLSRVNFVSGFWLVLTKKCSNSA
jgi:hypothetical protein